MSESTGTVTKDIRWLISLLPKGLNLDPGSMVYRFFTPIAEELEKLMDWIEDLRGFIPADDKPVLKLWEEMLGIKRTRTGPQRAQNIISNLLGEFGSFNKTVVKKIIAFYTSDDIILTTENDTAFRAGEGRAGQRLSNANSIFKVFLNIENNKNTELNITEENKKLLVEEINRVKHVHLDVIIKFQGVPYA